MDVVTGATYSSNAIADAYLDAYKKAVEANGGKTDDTDKEDTKKDTPDVIDDGQEEATGTITDGTCR
ncbi:MAG: hypothetical protein ACI4C5_04130, partial [Lachnospiraceae bacterium]